MFVGSRTEFNKVNSHKRQLTSKEIRAFVKKDNESN